MVKSGASELTVFNREQRILLHQHTSSSSVLHSAMQRRNTVLVVKSPANYTRTKIRTIVVTTSIADFIFPITLFAYRSKLRHNQSTVSTALIHSPAYSITFLRHRLELQGQLYVALSRVKSRQGLKLLILDKDVMNAISPNHFLLAPFKATMSAHFKQLDIVRSKGKFTFHQQAIFLQIGSS
ncbi:hypothetical protein LXL04_018967 [Taraxacum kok-saghyz]